MVLASISIVPTINLGFVTNIQENEAHAIIDDDGTDNTGCPSGFTVYLGNKCQGPLMKIYYCNSNFQGPSNGIYKGGQCIQDYRDGPCYDRSNRCGATCSANGAGYDQTVVWPFDTRAFGILGYSDCHGPALSSMGCPPGYTITKQISQQICSGPRKS